MANPSTGSLTNTEPVCATATAGAHRSSPGDLFCDRSKRKRESSDGSRNNRSTHEAHCRSSQAVVSSTWSLSHHPMTAGIIGLHKEIEAFVDWIVPNEAEHNIRLSVIDRISTTIYEVYPECSVHIFGSFRTGLYLPTSDIDLVLVGNWDQIPFDVVSKGIERKNIAKPGTLQLLEHATVPIIKLTDHLTNIKVDISFNMTNGIKAVQLINFFKSHYPAMSKLIYVLKQFLLQRDLNEVYTGGLSSYALILMVVSFLQLHLRSDARSENPNLGVLLMEFFELYGRHFNYTNTAISVVQGGAYLPKDEVRNSMTSLNQGFLCIQDPYDPENDVGKSSYGIPVVKTAFEKAYVTLSKLVLERKDGILNSIIQVPNEVVNIRNWAKSTFGRGCLPVFSLDNDIDEPQSQSFLEALLLPPCDAQDRKCDECQVNGTNQGSSSLKSDDKLANLSAANSSDSASSQAETDFDEFPCGSGRALSPSGSSSSSMSVSPPASEAGSEANVGQGHNTRSSNIKGPEKKQRYFPVGFSRNGGRNNVTGDSSLLKDRSDKALDWRKDCLRQEESTRPSHVGLQRSQADQQLNSEKLKGGEVQINQVKSSKDNKPLSDVNTDEKLSKPPKMDKCSDVAILNREKSLEPNNETPDRLSGCIDENFRIKTSKKKRRNQNKSWQSQTKNVDLNGMVNSQPVKNPTQSAANNDLTSGSVNSVIKQDKKRSNKEALPKQPKRDQPQQPQDQSRNHTHNRFSSRVGQSKPKR